MPSKRFFREKASDWVALPLGFAEAHERALQILVMWMLDRLPIAFHSLPISSQTAPPHFAIQWAPVPFSRHLLITNIFYCSERGERVGQLFPFPKPSFHLWLNKIWDVPQTGHVWSHRRE